MDLHLMCEQGCSEYLVQECSLRKIKGTVEQHDRCVIIRGVSEEDAIKAAYLLQTPLGIGLLLGAAEVSVGLESTLIELSALLGTLPLSELFTPGQTFAVSVNREGTHEYNSVDISQEAGRVLKRLVKERLQFMPEVDLKKPAFTLSIQIDQKSLWLSLSLAGLVAKRKYKVFNNPHAVKGPIAACLLMAAGWKPGLSLLDPFSSGGVISIEAALMSTSTSLHYFDKTICTHHLFGHRTQVLEALDATRAEQDPHLNYALDAQLRNITAAKKNAKIAGVDKSITFSKMDVEWIDTKMSSQCVDHIVCQPVESSKHVDEERARKIHKDLFYQADYVLKKTGSITVLCHKPELLSPVAQMYGFEVSRQQLIHAGHLPLWITTYKKR